MVVTRQAQYALFDGSAWGAAGKVPGSTDSLYGASCLSTSFCDAVNGFDALTYDGSTWSTPMRLPRAKGVLSISCTSPTFCAASGYVLAFVWDGESWTKSQRMDRKTNLGSDSGVSPSVCMPSDDKGRALEWSGSAWSPAGGAIPGSDLSSAVSCASETFCVMTAEHNSEASFFDGSRWSDPVQIDPPAHGGVIDIDCPNERFCTALDRSGYVVNWHRAA